MTTSPDSASKMAGLDSERRSLIVSWKMAEADTDTGLRRLSLVKNIAWSVDTKQELARLLRDEKPQIVHVHNTFMMMSPSVFAACREAGVPVIQTLHNYRLFCPAANFVRDGKPCEECVEHTLL